MNGGMPRRQQGGFTIVEILIVLAVTGALFLSTVLLISGKQNVTSFNQSIRNIQTELQQYVSEVSAGYYGNNGAMSCKKGGPAGGTLLTSTPTEQGANKDCIFLGKVLQFAVQGNAEQYNVYTLVGLKGNSSAPSLDLSSAKARLVARGTAATDAAVPDAFETKELLYGLTVSQVTRMYYANAAGSKVADIGAVAFASSLSNLGSGDGSQQVNVVALPLLPSPQLDLDKATAVERINGKLATGIVNPAGGVKICFNSGATNQSGLISVGGSGRQASVELKVFTNKDCV